MELAKLSSMVTTSPKGYQRASQWWHVMVQASKRMETFWGEFGLTPSSRTRVKVEGVNHDAFEAYRNKSQGN